MLRWHDPARRRSIRLCVADRHRGRVHVHAEHERLGRRRVERCRLDSPRLCHARLLDGVWLVCVGGVCRAGPQGADPDRHPARHLPRQPHWRGCAAARLFADDRRLDHVARPLVRHLRLAVALWRRRGGCRADAARKSRWPQIQLQQLCGQRSTEAKRKFSSARLALGVRACPAGPGRARDTGASCSQSHSSRRSVIAWWLRSCCSRSS